MTVIVTREATISEIRRDGGTQIRIALDEYTVADYAAAVLAKEKLPPVRVFNDGTDFWLVDGFHRVEAALRAGKKRIYAEVRPGTRADAILAACAANATHGLRRSNADKRRATQTALLHPDCRDWSDRKVAKHVGVDHGTVATVRGELSSVPSEQSSPITLCKVAISPPEPAKDSTSGQPTSDSSPENPTAEGKEGAGGNSSAATQVAPPVPDEPSIDEPIPYVVVEPRDRLVNVERMLRDAQAEIAPLLIRGEALAVQVALNEALVVVRRALQPMAMAPAQERAGWPEPPHGVRPRRLQIQDDMGRDLVLERDEDGAAQADTDGL